MSGASAWDFTRRLSPRRYVRVRGWDEKSQRYGYKPQHWLTAEAPATAWAVHLTDERRRFVLLAFDFDAKAPTPALQSQFAARADADVQRLVALLSARGIEHTVCASGPGGGRHVWLAPVAPLPLATVRQLAKLTQTICPSLDTRPLSNESHGLVRPPGAPHYSGGCSRWIAGAPPAALLEPSVTDAQFDALLGDLEELAAQTLAARASAPAPDRRTAADLDPCELRSGGPLPVATDVDGAPHLPGARRPLPRRILDRAHAPLSPTDDGSAEQFRILCSAAAARWSFAQVLDELASLPGMEHARSVRVDGGRVPRTPAAQAAVLREDWNRAVARVSRRQAPTQPHGGYNAGDYARFDQDAGAIVDALEHLRRRADLSRGRWRSRTGAVDRLVLATLMLIAAETIKTVIAADIRTVAIRTVCIGRESARESLHRLARDGWIALHTESVGAAAAEWELLPYGTTTPDRIAGAPESPVTSEKTDPLAVIHRSTSRKRSHQHTGGARGEPPTAPTPPGTGSERRDALLRRLRSEQGLFGHDCFTADHPDGLGAAAAWVYSQLPENRTPLELLVIAGYVPTEVELHVRRLWDAGLVDVTGEGIERTVPVARDAYAAFVGTAGIAAARAEQYAIESAVWAWWCSEEHVVAVHATGATTSAMARGFDSGRVGIRDGQRTFELDTTPHWADLPPYPRGRLGRPNHPAAYAYIAGRRDQQRRDELHAA